MIKKKSDLLKSWHSKISNIAQIGGIETSILDNGTGKGTRIAWVNTGSGLRYKIVIDRAMDIVDSFFNAHSLSWISHSGVTLPNQSANEGMKWLTSFSGGLITTCGLSHIGGPEGDEYGNRGLHGNISNIPAEIISVKQPDLLKSNDEISITGIVRESNVFGPHLELRRTITSKLLESKIKVHDEVTNVGNEDAPHMVLYHCNFGWPIIDKGTEILWTGNWESRGHKEDNMVFNPHNDFTICPSPIEGHNGNGEAACFIKAGKNKEGNSICGVYNRNLELALFITFDPKKLPWLTNWQHFGHHEYVTALEPATNPPVGQKSARTSNTLQYLKKGETKNYEIEIEIHNDINQIKSILNGNFNKR